MEGDGDGGACLVAACTSEQLRGAPTVPREEGMTRADEERVDAYFRELHGAGYMRPENERWREGRRGRLDPFAGAAARALDGRDRLHGHGKPKKRQVEFLARYIGSLYPAAVRPHFVLDKSAPTKARRGSGQVRTTSRHCATSAWPAPTPTTPPRLVSSAATSPAQRARRGSDAPSGRPARQHGKGCLTHS